MGQENIIQQTSQLSLRAEPSCNEHMNIMSANKRSKPNANRQNNGLHPPKRRKMTSDLINLLNVVAAAGTTKAAAAANEEAADRSQTVFLILEDIENVKGKINASHDQNNKIQDEINDLRKHIEKEGHNQKQGGTVKLQEELQKAKIASDATRDQNNKLQEEINELEKGIEKKSIQENDGTKTSPPCEIIRALQSSIHKLLEENNQLRNQDEKRRKQIEALQRKVTKLTNEFLSEQTKSKKSQKEIAKSKKLLQEMAKKHQQIKEKLKDMETKLALGQVAWSLEKEIWKFVLPSKKMGKTGIFQCMERWLLENSSRPEGQKAKERWEKLKGELKWNDSKHRFGLHLLKEVRSEEAHPKEFDVEEARKELKHHIADPFQKRCKEIIDMVIKAKQLNSSKST